MRLRSETFSPCTTAFGQPDRLWPATIPEGFRLVPKIPLMQKITTCVAAVLLPLSSTAADTIDEITVTATRRAESLTEVSAAVAVVREDEVAPVLTDSLRDAVGVYVQQTTPGQGAVILRGLRGSAVLHLVDGMRLNNAIFRDAPTQYFSLVPATAIERVEILRGSPTSLYGSDAVGGVVQAVTKLPRFEASGQRGDLSLRVDSAELAKSLAGTFEFGDERLAAGISASTLATGNRRIGGGERVGPSNFESTSLRAVVSATPSENRSWYVDAQYLEQPETPRFDELVAGFGQTEPDSLIFSFKPNSRAFLHGQFQQSFERFDWVVDGAWQQIDDDRESLGSGDTALRLEENRSSLFGLTSRWSGETAGVAWIAGAEAYLDTVDSARREVDLMTGATSALASRFPDGSKIEQTALFANGHRRVVERLQLGGGLRFSRVDVDLAATELTAATTVKASDISADLGMILDLDDALQLTANAGFGFRAPNVFDLGTLGNRTGNRFNIPNTSLDSEKVSHYDIGLRHLAGASSWEVVAYFVDYSDRITSVSTNTETDDGRDIVQSTNAAAAEIYGIEAGFRVSLNELVRLRGTVNYSRGEQTVDGLTEPSDRIPPLGGHLAIEYQVHESTELHAELHFADQQDRLSARDVNDNRIDPDGTPGWTTLNIGTHINLPANTKLSLLVDNILDQGYRYHGSGIDAPGRNLRLQFRKLWR